MSLIATLALAASAGSTLPQCSWDRPGVNPFMGDVVAAVDRYQDIPAATRNKLKARMKARSYDDIALIERNAITGRADYAPEIRDMHFGAGSVCRTVTRAKWAATTQERGLVYCEDGECILVPTVCRNVSRIRRVEKPAATGAATVAASTREAEQAPLEFEAPAAGPMPAATPETFATASGVPALSETPATGGITLPGTPTTVTPGGGGGGLIDLGIPGLPPGRVPTDIPAVPEPSTWAMIALGLLVIAFRARQRRR